MLKKAFLKVLERQNLQNQTRSELYTNDNKSKYSSNPKDIFISEKLFYQKLYTKYTTSKATFAKFLSKIPNIKKISKEKFNLYEAKISLDEIIKFINSETNNISSGNEGLTVKFYKHFSNELAPMSFYSFITPGESFASWVLLLEQESYLSRRVTREGRGGMSLLAFFENWKKVP